MGSLEGFETRLSGYAGYQNLIWQCGHGGLLKQFLWITNNAYSFCLLIPGVMLIALGLVESVLQLDLSEVRIKIETLTIILIVVH